MVNPKRAYPSRTSLSDSDAYPTRSLSFTKVRAVHPRKMVLQLLQKCLQCLQMVSKCASLTIPSSMVSDMKISGGYLRCISDRYPSDIWDPRVSVPMSCKKLVLTYQLSRHRCTSDVVSVLECNDTPFSEIYVQLYLNLRKMSDEDDF